MISRQSAIHQAPFAGSLIAFVIVLYLLYSKSNIQENKQDEVDQWLKENNILNFKKEITSDCRTIVSCVKLWRENLDAPADLSSSARAALIHAVNQKYTHLVFHQWLHNQNLLEVKDILYAIGVGSLKDISELKTSESLSSLFVQSLSSSQYNYWITAEVSLPVSDNDLEKLTLDLWDSVLSEERTPWSVLGMMTMSLIIAVLVGMAITMSQAPVLHDSASLGKLNFFSWITGKYLAPQNCRVEFDWKGPQTVGSTMSFVVKFFQRNYQPYPVCNEDNVLIEVTQGSYKVACSIELGGTQPCDCNKAKVQFTVRRSGDYCISVLIDMVHIRGSPFIKSFLPDSPDPLKTAFVHHCSTVVCSEGIPSQLFIEPRDRYGNLCNVDAKVDPKSEYHVTVVEVCTQQSKPEVFHWERYPRMSRIALVLKFANEGCYHVTVSHKEQNLKNGDFNVIVLNKDEAILVQKNVSKKNNWYEAKLLAFKGEVLAKPKKVYCYISPKQLTIKEYMFKIIPKHIVTFRLCPSTKFQFQSQKNNYEDQPMLVVDDGNQPKVELISQDRNVIAATFTQFLLKNIGGSETFKDKQDFFYHEVRKYHQKHFHDKLPVKVQRDKLLESSFKATKGLSTSEWCKSFEISFIGEEGLDWGGLRREWFELICCALFDPENLLFHTFKSDKQGLVHPNPYPKRPNHLKLKYYEFAGKIVGKCLYESALGSSYRQLVKAKFSRSFLAQLIGLGVSYKDFEHDDPDLYVNKVKYIIDNDVSAMDLYFVEEEYSSSGQLLQEAELVNGGSHMQVTNKNKHDYLNALAQYRLANSVKEEVEYFLKGLNELIPDNLLCIFDENELELLMCGTGFYSIADFKANHAVSGSSYEFRKVLDWFWTAVSNFTEEEMARLLQFTTGCSQLPPGGFSELSPKFHITAATTFGNLPTAHTCFNQLCLPDYDSYEQFEKALRLAINEGSEGFGMI